jgi:hypothetical protein
MSNNCEKKHNFCKKECCVEEEVLNCCTIAYQKLIELKSIWSLIISTYNHDLPLYVDGQYLGYTINSSGNKILIPTKNIFQNFDQNGIGLVTSDEQSEIYSIDKNLAYYAYLFVNTLRYSPTEECGKKDQLYGWLFDTSTENLEVFHNIDELKLNPSVNRLTLLETPRDKLTKIQKKQLSGLNALYKLSLKALSKAIIGKRDGSIVSVEDKTGQRWTIAINLTNSLSIYSKSTQYVIIAIPECN